MAYTHTQHVKNFTTTVGSVRFSATASGAVGNVLYAGPVAEIVRAVAYTQMTSGAGNFTGFQLTFTHLKKTPLGNTATAIATLNGADADDVGQVVYKNNLNVKIMPGEGIGLNIDNTATGGTADFTAMALVEPSWIQPRSLGNMRLTT